MLPGPYGKIASAVLPAIGGMIAAPAGASLAESGKRSLTGDPITGKDDLKNKLAEQRLMSEQDLISLVARKEFKPVTFLI
jgi:hypothetical protein